MTDRIPSLDDGPDPRTHRTAPDEARPPQRKTMLEQWGGVPGMIYMTLPVVAFVVANSLLGLNGAIVTAVGAALAVTAVRLVRKESLAPALNGLTGVAVAAGISWWTGSAKDYFLLGIWLSLAGAVVFTGSVLIRRPLAGLLWNAVKGQDHTWREDKVSRRYYDVATLALAAVFAARFVVQQWLYDSDEAGWLGFAKIAMGYPLLGLALLVVAWAARRSARRLDALSQARTRPGSQARTQTGTRTQPPARPVPDLRQAAASAEPRRRMSRGPQPYPHR
ncbi:DUF3159 domain-containing protein [Streptomyces parvulus]|uniref:DUF3159 domain-containing protein n=1 Tax=Streptomyces parvulus TaxID=146923 RepID=UPI003408C286